MKPEEDTRLPLEGSQSPPLEATAGGPISAVDRKT